MSKVSVRIRELMASSGVGFGTSGARGTVEAMTNSVCYAYVMGFLQAMRDCGAIDQGASVYVAGDLRPSTDRIMAVCVRAVTDGGYLPVYAGHVPSPAVAYAATSESSASIMVTGSHIPDDRNGIKFNRPDGEILKADEELICAQVVEVPEPFPEIDPSELPSPDRKVEKLYIARYLNYFDSDCLQGMSVGVYQHSGVARDLLVTLLAALGARVTELARSDVFVPVDTEAIRAEDVVLAEGWASEGVFDAVVSTDGDADRPFIADEYGHWLRGDIVGVLCARFAGIDALATPVSSNTVVESCGWFKCIARTRIGSPYVIEGMNSLLSQSAGRVAGYEANGGFLLGSDIRHGERVLEALPTRDAVLPILAVLMQSKAAGSSVGRLVAELPERYTASNRLKNFPSHLSHARIDAMGGSAAAIESVFGHLSGSVKSIDKTDGLRIVFDNDEIIHLRASGNAPELRCYTEASSAERVSWLNDMCMQSLEEWRS